MGRPKTPRDVEERRQLRCQTITGVPEVPEYWRFRKQVMAAGRLFMKLTLISEYTLPKGAFVLVPNHSSFLDIPAAGQVNRVMAWPCKPSFVPTEGLARHNQRMGAIPFARQKDLDRRPSAVYRFLSLIPGVHPVRLVDKVLDREEMMAKVVNALQHNPVVMFAQGERKSGAGSSEWYPGAAIAAIQANVPLVPMAVYGLGKSDVHRRTRFGLRRRALAVICPAIFPNDYDFASDERAKARLMMMDWEESVGVELTRCQKICES